MNDFVIRIILAIFQGITEWLPISSSGHLVFVSWLLNFENSLELDVALHFGTLMAVFVYFGKDVMDMLEALLKGKWKSDEAKMAYLLIVSSIPAAIIGLSFKKYFELAFGSILLTGIGFGITSMVLFISSLEFNNKKTKIGWMDSFLIGCAQAVAMFPGISRSGTTISAGLLRGLDEKNALKFSFLMSIPVIFGANLVEIGNKGLPAELILPTFVSFIFGILTIHVLFKYFLNKKKNLRWFAWYCLILFIGIVGYLLFFN